VPTRFFGSTCPNLNEEDDRAQPLEKRKVKLERLLAGSTGVRSPCNLNFWALSQTAAVSR
jgi:hypothetical protein